MNVPQRRNRVGHQPFNQSASYGFHSARRPVISSDYTLEAGDIIYLKGKRKKAAKPYTVYIVRDGDSMHSISQKYGIRLKNLYKMNRKDAEYVPEVGDRLRLR